MRSAGPIMGEFWGQTLGLFFWFDVIKDKFRATRDFGQDFPGFPQWIARIYYTSLAVYISLFNGYPFRMIRHFVEELPRNNQGEVLFKTYAECFWKAIGDNFKMWHLWNGFHRYLIKAAPPLWITVWFADSIGLLEQTEFLSVWAKE